MNRRLGLLLLFAWIAIFAFGEDMNWSRVGLVAGNIEAILPDRAHPGIFYLLETRRPGYYYYNRDSSLYRSSDNGQTWKYTGINHVLKAVVHSASSEVFIVRRGRDSKFELLSSADLGRTFRLRSGNAPERVFDHPTDPNILWGSGIGRDFYDLSASFDRGAHWQTFSNLPYKMGKEYEIYGDKYSPDGYYLSSILPSPLDPKTVYVSTEVEFPISCSGETIDMELVSTNSGKSWVFAEVPNVRYIYDAAFPNRAFSVGYNETRILTPRGWQTLTSRRFQDIAGVPGRPNLLYGLYEAKQWISHDGGANWSRVELGPGGNARVVQARAYPEGSLLAGTSGGGVYVIDESRNWHQITDGFRNSSVYDIATAPGSNILFAVTRGMDGFLYRSTNSGQSWKNITDNLPRSPGQYSYPRVVVNQRNARHVFALVNGRIAVSLNAGETWKDVSPKSLSGVFFDPDDKTVYFSKDSHGHLYKSTDGGITLHELPAEFGSPKNTIRDLAVDPFSGYLYAATERGLYVSRNGGQTAEQIATDLFPDCLTCLAFSQIVVLPQRGQYLALAGEWIYKSVNQGVSWKRLSQARGKVYVADDKGLHLFLINGRLLESEDGGQTWNPISASVNPGLAPNHDESINAMSDPRHRPLYLATSLGIFRTGR